MADPSADAPPAMSDAQAETLRGVVANLRRCLPDPSARDVHDAIVEHDPAMAAWATASRVKKLCTKMNKELRSGRRRGDEPDETDGPVLVEALSRWPTTQQPVFLHVAARGDSRVFFPHEHHTRVEGEDATRVPLGVAFRRSVAEAARMLDARVAMWRLIATEPDAGPDADATTERLDRAPETRELVIVCEAAKVLPASRARRAEETKDAPAGAAPAGAAPAATRDARCVFEVAFTVGDAGKNAHKRLLEKPLAENAGAIGEIRLSRGAWDVWLCHLRRNRHYEDKYSGNVEARAWWDENILALPAARDGAPQRAQTWESSYVVTPNAEWFR